MSRRTQFQIRRQIIKGIKQKAIITAQIVTPDGKRRRNIEGNSQFEVVNSNIDRQRIISQAIFNAFYRGINRYNFPSGSYLVNVELIGYATPKQVNVKRVKVRSQYRTYVYVEGRRGLVKNIKWSPKLKDDTNEIADETGIGKQDHWRN